MEEQYLLLLRRILEEGETRTDRTGTGTLGLFAPRMECDLREGFPLLTTKEVKWRMVMHELLWFIKGQTNIKPLLENRVHIWSEWPHQIYCNSNPAITLREFERRILEDTEFAEKWGDLGPVYGAMWRTWPDGKGGYIDQLKDVQKTIRNNPSSRRIIITAWNPAFIDRSALPPCHVLIQFHVGAGKLNCHLYQRSADMFLGVPFNIASYAMLTTMMARVCGLEPGRFIHTLGDAHIYLNHIEQVRTQLSRHGEIKAPPQLVLTGIPECITEFTPENITVENYSPMPFIKAPVAV